MDEKEDKKKESKKVSAKVTCPHCGKEYETEVEVPEPSKTPKMTWST